MRILVVRVDKIGDFCHTLPAIYLLKRSLPNSQIDVIVSSAVQSFAEQFSFIDHVLVYKKNDNGLLSNIKNNCYHAALMMHSNKAMSLISKAAKIPFRLGQRRKWFQYTFTHRVTQNRSACLKPEWRYCTDLAEYFLCKQDILPADIKPRLWSISQEKEKWQTFYGQEDNESLIFIHPGSGGSEASLSPTQFAQLAKIISMNCHNEIKFIITHGNNEAELADSIVELISKENLSVLKAKSINNLGEFSRSLIAADMMIAGSTGPLHIASLHNVATLGFYPHDSRNGKIRWQALSDDWKRLSFSPPKGKKTGKNLNLIDMEHAGNKAATIINALSTY